MNRSVRLPHLRGILRRTVSWLRGFQSEEAATARVSQHWGKQGGTWRLGGASHWTELAAVQRRINTRISGEPNVDPYLYVIRRYFAGALPVARALTLGCGTGELERGLVQYGFCRHHDAFDIAAESIRKARDAARDAGLTHIHYQTCDVNRIALEPDAYDCAFGVHSVHHLEALEHVFSEVRKALRPGGYFILNEFVGPTRFQWTDRQLEVINGLLLALPERLRLRGGDGKKIKGPVGRPTITEMNLVDPSESIRSGDILPLLPRFFEVVEVKGYGGTVLQLLLHEIAGNFQNADPQTEGLLEAICDLEERLIALGDLPHDFALIVARKT
jgi:SAM-dependent methyltransferase